MSLDKLFHLQLETGLMSKLPRGYWYMVCLIRPQDYIRPGTMPLECQMVWRINLLSFQKPCKGIHWTNNNIYFQSSPSKYWQNTYFDNWRRGKLWYAIWRCSIVFHCFSFLFTLIHRKKDIFFTHPVSILLIIWRVWPKVDICQHTAVSLWSHLIFKRKPHVRKYDGCWQVLFSWLYQLNVVNVHWIHLDHIGVFFYK